MDGESIVAVGVVIPQLVQIYGVHVQQAEGYSAGRAEEYQAVVDPLADYDASADANRPEDVSIVRDPKVQED